MKTAIGIDIAKRKFDVAALRQGKYKTKTFPNTPQGFEALIGWLDGFSDLHVCMEATGVYGQALAVFLADRQVPLSVVNPARIAAYAKSELARSKTDRGDAKLIARFCHEKRDRLNLWQPPAPNERALQALVRRLDSLLEMQQMEHNRLAVAEAAVRPSLEAVSATLAAQIEAVREQIRRHIDNDPDLRQRRDLLHSIPGIGEATSAALLGLLGDVARFENAKQVAAYSGLSPALRTSGEWTGRTRLSKTGDSLLRKVLYMPALVAWRHNAVIRAFCERLKANGKNGKAIACAAMRKLLHIAYGVLKSGRPFDPEIALAR
ncbi:IS110 family transposase [Ectothiorhodospiraceae bacterium 2226]|nr:IS110 family transposase [Ectothiorhodospiraceae bacterium 2226]